MGQARASAQPWCHHSSQKQETPLSWLGVGCLQLNDPDVPAAIPELLWRAFHRGKQDQLDLPKLIYENTGVFNVYKNGTFDGKSQSGRGVSMHTTHHIPLPGQGFRTRIFSLWQHSESAFRGQIAKSKRHTADQCQNCVLSSWLLYYLVNWLLFYPFSCPWLLHSYINMPSIGLSCRSGRKGFVPLCICALL